MAPKKETRNDSGTVKSGKFTLKYTIEGSGTPALIIGSAVYYPRIFSHTLRNHLQLIFTDHRGFAQSAEPTDIADFTLDILLDDIEKIRQELGLGRVIIIGHSGHGYMALEYAKKYPDYVSHVVLIGMGPDQGPINHQAAEQYWQDSVCPERKKVLEENLQHLPQELEAHPQNRFITFCIRLGAKSWFNFDFDATPLWQGVQVNMHMIDYVWGTIFRDIDITQGLETFNKPIFLGLGKYDFLVAPFFSWNTIKPKFKNLTIRLFEQSSHTPQFEEPELFDQELLTWLKKNS